MACLSEFKYAVYADGELPEVESRVIAQHLDGCRACRLQVEALREESRALVYCLQETDLLEFELEDETLSAPRGGSLSLTRLSMVVLALSSLLRPVINVLVEMELPESVSWLNPLSASAQLSLLMDGVLYGIPAAIEAGDSLLKTATSIVFGCIVCLAIVMLFRRSALKNVLLSLIALLTVFSSSGWAMEVLRSGAPITVPPGETIDDTLLVAGDSVNIDGTVTGDLIAFVREVRIRGTVKGNVITFAQRLEVEGVVEGSIFSAGGWVETRGKVMRNLYAAAGNVRIAEQGSVDGNATVFAGEGTVEGAVGKDFSAYSARSIGWGPFQTSKRGGLFSVTAPARIGRHLTLKVDNSENARIDPAAEIGGRTDIRVPPPRPSRYQTASFYVWQTIWLAAALLTGLVLFWLAPALARVDMDTGRALLIAGGIGFLTVVAPPVAAVIAGITLVGLPLGLMTLAMWITAGYLAKIVIAGFLGRALLQRQGDGEPGKLVMLLAGLIPVFVAINLPYIGGIIEFLLVLLGLGALVTTGYRASRWAPAHAA